MTRTSTVHQSPPPSRRRRRNRRDHCRARHRARPGGPLKVGVILPRSGFEAGIGQDCQRGVDIAPPILKSLGLPELPIMNGDTESNVDTARERAEKLISDGAQLLIGAFDSGQTTAVAQVAEQKGIPLVINVGSAPADHRAGLQVRGQKLPDRADAAQRMSSPSK